MLDERYEQPKSPGRQDGGKEKFLPCLAFLRALRQQTLCAEGLCEGMILLAGLALSSATDVIIRKIQGKGQGDGSESGKPVA